MLTLCDGQLAVPTSNSALCVYVLEYYSILLVCLSQLMFVIFPNYILPICYELLYNNTKCDIVLCICCCSSINSKCCHRRNLCNEFFECRTKSISLISVDYMEFEPHDHSNIYMTSIYTQQIFVRSATRHSGNASGKDTEYHSPIPSHYHV